MLGRRERRWGGVGDGWICGRGGRDTCEDDRRKGEV